MLIVQRTKDVAKRPSHPFPPWVDRKHLIDSEPYFSFFQTLFQVLGFIRTALNLAFHIYQKLERVKGIEPSLQPWQGRGLPLHYTRIKQILHTSKQLFDIHFLLK